MPKTNTFDYIIIGAGPGGSSLASRLSEDPSATVALLEAGGENVNSVSRMQGAFARVWGTGYDWGYSTTPQKELSGRSIYQPRGKVVGGSSAINVGVWLRGAKEDYDSWEQQGAKGWNFENALRLFKKIEDSDRGPSATRGKGGPVYMEDMPSAAPKLSDSLRAAFVEAGLGTEADTNGPDPIATCKIQSIYESRRRRTIADDYLGHEARKRPNLHIFTGSHAHHLLFTGQKATGVEYAQYEKATHTLHAAKEIILCAGAYNTPQLLLLSGIGPKEELAALGIPVVADVPGVGKNLQDHLYVGMKVLAPANIKESVPMDNSDEAIKTWTWTQSGPATYYSGTGVGFFPENGGKSGQPGYELILDYNAGASGDEAVFKNTYDAKGRSGYNISVVQLHPASRGSVALQSKDPEAAPLIDPGYLTDESDLPRFVAAFRRAAEMIKTSALSEYTDLCDPPLDASDEDLAAYIRENATTVFHPVGTARMGSKNDPLAVVDETLRVKGVEGLRIADASVIPTLISGHTMAPTTVIGERAAELIHTGV